MATLTANTLLGGAGGDKVFPPSLSEEIWQEAATQSIIPNLAKQHPVTLGENVIPVLTKSPAASIVGEGENKPDSKLEIGAKSMRPIKAVVGLEFTMETLVANPGNALEIMGEQLSGALARQIDLAILHGRQASDGAQLSGNPEYLAQTTNRVKLGATPDTIDGNLWAGYDMVVGGDKVHDFNGFAMDPRMVSMLANARDKEGRRLNNIPMGGQVDNYAGQPVTISRSVSGQMDASVDTKIRGFGGDWNALRFGRALEIGLKKIEYGDPFGNGDLQRRNAVAFLTEVIFGWVILDKDAFVAYEVGESNDSSNP